jgi:VIT1/CCC1 family predicted Fe2+/Mn2+ transporter
VVVASVLIPDRLGQIVVELEVPMTADTPSSDHPDDPIGRDASPGPAEWPGHASAHLLSTSVSKLNRLRAAVLGANDGITSTAGLVAGVAGAAASSSAVLIAGVSGLAAGAFSMGGGEYTSVRAQRDSHDALLARQRRELDTRPHEELDELAYLYAQKGLSPRLAREVAAELSSGDALAAHADIELGIDVKDLVNPWEAAMASATSFLLGGVLPLLAILLPPHAWRVPVCFAAVLITLSVTGYVAARLGQAPAGRATVRNAAVGFTAMLLTYAIGTAVGHVA